ncbi:MAG: hypothetical protein HOO96_30270, partial [Polyangiaceae bacterium]|nr:hypothetical protein [Polyangiaceae bacterium]
VLASVDDAPRNESLERRLRADAKAFFDARRKPRTATTTSGTEVVIVEGVPEAPAAPPRSRWWAAAWVAAAASVAVGVFAARARTLPSGASFHDPGSVGAHIEVEASSSLLVSGLGAAPQGCHYVLWVRPAGGPLRRAESFDATAHRHLGAPASGTAAVTLETTSGGSRRVVVARSWGREP